MYLGKENVLVDVEFETDDLFLPATTDTSVGMIHAFLLQMVLYPNIQHRAQAELDTLTHPPSSPSFRLPTFDDRTKLPYIEGLLKEAIRWNPTVATGAPHGTTQEDTYRGWRIPKGAIVFPNAWGMLRDDKVYRDPYVFDPDRFVGSPGRPAERDPGGAGAFGFGRR
ncbi:MAG TPA: cytochrome P450 [Chlamydiales bacterium]|jgi:cytochrome P450|nr:cytochrome P450 [Chlamydiales bacterium]